MIVDPADITTREVLDWKGLHLLNFFQSSCSQKVRILLSEKGVDYQSREINLAKGEHLTTWYLGINARGVVPVLIDDGQVHIESNDILQHIEEKFPSPGHSWIPDDEDARTITTALLKVEDDLHTHLRVITMGFIAPQALVKKSDEQLRAYEENGAEDAHRTAQVAWWRAFAEDGITDTQVRDAVLGFHNAFQALEEQLGQKDWLLGEQPSVLDIAWFINLHRAVLAGYPLETHPALTALYERMRARPAFSREISKGPLPFRVVASLYRAYRRLGGTTLRPAALEYLSTRH